MLKWFFILILVVSGILGGSYLFLPKKPLISGSIEEEIGLVWQRELEKMVKNKQLPPFWGGISQVSINPLTPLARQWLDGFSAPLKENSEGAYILDVFFFIYKKKKSYQVILQYDILDKKTSNWIWEGGQTFYVLRKNQVPGSPKN